jgi:uncharacterized protein (TIGR02145 family)/uncharacterized repeat protein (TIGR02543 family)
MKKWILQVLFGCVAIATLFFFCANPPNPYVRGNAKISVYLENSQGLRGLGLSVTDTIGNTVKIGVSTYLYNYIDSVEVTMVDFNAGSDSVIVIKRFSSDSDTLWFDFTFTKIKKYTFTVKAYEEGTEPSNSGSITIFGKTVSATIQPPTETTIEDSVAAFLVSSTADTPLTYQWFHDTVPLVGTTGASFIKNHVTQSDSGKYSCLVRDKWGDSGFAATPAILAVIPKGTVKTNSRPVISVSGHTSILSFEVCSLTVSARDPDSGQVLTFAVVKAPAGFAFSANLFTWAPFTGYLGADTVKTDTAVFTVTDNGKPPLSDTQRVIITVSSKIIPPDSVKGVTGVSRFNGVFVFKWNKSANADQYVIYRSKDTTGFSQCGTTQDTTFSNSIKDTAFYYYVVATNSKASSFPSQRIRSTVINAAPTWSHNAIAVTINEGVSFSLNLADSVRDTNGDDITLQMVSAGPVNDSLVGTTWKYTPSYRDSGAYTVKIKAWDGLDSSILNISLHVVDVPRPPQPQSQSLLTKRNTALQITLTASDPDGDSVTSWVIDTQATHGAAVLANASKPVATYTPVTGYVGTDYFTFKALVGNQASVYSAKVTIRVDTNNIAPVISQKLSNVTRNKGDSLILAVTTNSDAFPSPWFYWYKAGIMLDSTQANVWKKPNLALADSGHYYVIVKNLAGRDSSSAMVFMQNAPAISNKLAATTTVNAGGSTPISITTNSDAVPVPTIQWYFNGQAISPYGTSLSYSKTWSIADTGTYKVVVSNAAGKDSSFTKLNVNPLPNIPTLILPADGAAGQPVSLTLIWNKGSIASGYFVQVAADTGFASVVVSDTTLTDTTKAVSGLSKGTAYYWRVRAKNTVGISVWSGRRIFTTIKQFTLTITATNGSVTKTPDNAQYDSGSTVGLKARPSTGYNFGSWSGDAAGTSDSATIVMTGQKNVTATFPTKIFLVKFNSNGGSKVDSQNVAYNGIVTSPTAPTKPGYTFGAWYTEAALTNVWTFATNAVTSDTTLYAKWTPVVYTITFDGQGATTASNPASKNVVFPATTIDSLPVPPLKTGYIFGGWWTGTNGSGTMFKQSTIVTASLRVYAKWGGVIDTDGNVYATVTIGTQTWMAENLKTTRLNNGTAITLTTDGTSWAAQTSSAFCWANNNDSAIYQNTYGALYNWYTVNTGNLAPSGWHVATDADWSTLTTFLGGDSLAGVKTRESGTTHWQTNMGATNETGFTALPSGYRGSDGSVGGPSLNCYFWTSTSSGSNTSWYRYIYDGSNIIFRFPNNVNAGFSIRCVKN